MERAPGLRSSFATNSSHHHVMKSLVIKISELSFRLSFLICKMVILSGAPVFSRLDWNDPGWGFAICEAGYKRQLLFPGRGGLAGGQGVIGLYSLCPLLRRQCFPDKTGGGCTVLSAVLARSECIVAAPCVLGQSWCGSPWTVSHVLWVWRRAQNLVKGVQLLKHVRAQ